MTGRRIHFMGIGGVGMAALAVLMKRRGFDVDGCDLKSTPRTRWLGSLGIPVAIGHDVAHVAAVDEVIVTPAVHADNPERLAAPRMRYRGEVLAELVNAAADSIVVCGSHGKTTTATYIARLLAALGESVEWAIGGETGEFKVAGRVGDGNDAVLVVEGDESDGTLMAYRPKTLVITNVEYDHPDHFPTASDYEACFETARQHSCQVIEGRMGASANPNADLAMAVALRRGHSRESIVRELEKIVDELPDRRFQRLADGVYADYAHHPSEIRYTLHRARAMLNGNLGARLIVLFQPHRYSRTLALKADFAAALRLADEVILCPTYAAFESPIAGGRVEDLLAQMAGANVTLADSCEAAWQIARQRRNDGDLTLLLGAGDIINLVPLIAAQV